MRCPCGTGLPYDECCRPIHRGDARAASAERLMRSRYSAFALGNASWLLESWHPSTRPASIDLDDDVTWYRLDILARTGGGLLDISGTVEFEAHYRSPAGASSQREISRFVKDKAGWFYVAAV